MYGHMDGWMCMQNNACSLWNLNIYLCIFYHYCQFNTPNNINYCLILLNSLFTKLNIINIPYKCHILFDRVLSQSISSNFPVLQAEVFNEFHCYHAYVESYLSLYLGVLSEFHFYEAYQLSSICLYLEVLDNFHSYQAYQLSPISVCILECSINSTFIRHISWVLFQSVS